MRALHGFETINNRVSLQCCLRLKPILDERYAEEIEKFVDPNEQPCNDEKQTTEDLERKKAFRMYKQALLDNQRRVET